jgi:hypothetical protein
MDDTFLDPGGQPAGPQELTLSRARELASLLASGVLCYARLVGCRRGPAAATDGESAITPILLTSCMR